MATIPELKEIKPADPLVNRKYIPLNTPIFTHEGDNIILKPFSKNFVSDEEFVLKPREKYELNMKDMILDLYINSSKMLTRIIYYKESMKKNSNRVTIENIINLRNFKKSKKKKNDLYSSNKMLFNERFEKIGINYDTLPIFESHFESGNLQLVYYTQNIEDKDNINTNINNNSKINDIIDPTISNNSLNFNNSVNINTNNTLEETEKYELFLHNDTNTSGYTQWFFFRVSNVKKDKTLNLNIMNFLRKTTKYSNGVKIWVYSQKNFEKNNIGWHHTTEEVKYYKNFLYKLNKGKKEYYYTLSFNYTFKFDNDEVFFANCIPFTYTDLNKDLNIYTKNENDKYVFFDRKKLCSTILGNEVEFFSINNSSLNNNNNNNLNNINNTENKNGVVLLARQHPSETVGSWTIKGAIDFLLGDSDEAKYLRDNFVFKIIPMINVDGVICGNTRTSLSGCDLNRRWTNPNLILHPEIFYSKEMITNFSKKYKIECIVDFHGHFGAFNSFFYGNFKEDNFSFGKYFPFSCAKKSKVIQFEKSKFKMPKFKKGTGRINLFNELNIENVFTLETSYFGYQNKYFNCDTLQEIGRDICYGILLYHYHSNLNIGIGNNLSDYPLLKEKVENDEKLINNQFAEYIKEIKTKEEKTEIKNVEEKNDEEEVKNKTNDLEGIEDESDSESEPSKDNLDINEIMKLIPQTKKPKKILTKNVKRRKVNKRNFIGATHRSLNSNTYNLKKMANHGVILPYKNNNMNNLEQFYLPKVIHNKNKSNYIKDNDLEKIKKDLKTLDIDSTKNKETLKVDYSAKNLLVKIDPHTPNLKEEKSKFNLKIKLSLTFIEVATQTEEIFFQKKWTYFVGTYKIMFAKYENPSGSYHLKPIKFNSFKNSNSFINKHDNFFKNSILPPPKPNEIRQKNENKILNLIRQSKLHLNYINEIKGITSTNSKKSIERKKKDILLPFGSILPIQISPIDKFLKKNNNSESENKTNNKNNRYFSLALKNKEQKFVENPIIITQNIVLKKIDDKKEHNLFF